MFSGPFAYFTDFFSLIRFSKTNKHEMILAPLIKRFEKNCQLPEAIGLHFIGTTGVTFTRAKQVEEVFMTKNAFFSKHEISRKLSKPLLSDDIVTIATEHPLYKKKRKALSGAFFKTNMTQIAKNIKYVALQTFAELQQQGSSSVVDLNMFTRKA